MARQTCDRPNCNAPAVTLVADAFVQLGTGHKAYVPTSEFLCATHAPAEASVTS